MSKIIYMSTWPYRPQCNYSNQLAPSPSRSKRLHSRRRWQFRLWSTAPTPFKHAHNLSAGAPNHGICAPHHLFVFSHHCVHLVHLCMDRLTSSIIWPSPLVRSVSKPSSHHTSKMISNYYNTTTSAMQTTLPIDTTKMTLNYDSTKTFTMTLNNYWTSKTAMTLIFMDTFTSYVSFSTLLTLTSTSF